MKPQTRFTKITCTAANYIVCYCCNAENSNIQPYTFILWTLLTSTTTQHRVFQNPNSFFFILQCHLYTKSRIMIACILRIHDNLVEVLFNLAAGKSNLPNIQIRIFIESFILSFFENKNQSISLCLIGWGKPSLRNVNSSLMELLTYFSELQLNLVNTIMMN